jgi:hypothetical protein
MYTIKFNVPSASTIPPSELGKNSSGWTITGKIHEDYYEWVNYFEATHPDYGWVKGIMNQK